MDSCDQAEPDYAEPQRQVQRWLGRCMLSLQQSERLLKALLHDTDVTAVHSGREGEGAAAFEVSRAFEKERLASMTLGGLVTAFFGDVVADGSTSSDKRKERVLPDDRLSIRHSVRWTLLPEEFEALQSSMREMVDLRNQWVHHLVEQFNLTCVDGCAQALANLQQGYEKAERFRLKLQDIGKGIVEASKQMSAIVASPHVHGLLFHGRVPLESTPLLHALRDAMRGAGLAEDGTVLLSEVLTKLHALHPDEKPQNYGYASWPQVIHESRCFGMVRRDAEGHKAAPRVRLISSPERGV